MTNKKEVTVTERTYTQKEVDEMVEEAYERGYYDAGEVYEYEGY